MANVTDEPIPATEVQKPRNSRGCLYGCIFVVVAGVAMILCAGIGGYWFVSSQVAKYTSPTPVELPTFESTPEQLAELETRLNAFTEAFEQGETPKEDLVLTAQEINMMIAKEEKLRGKVFVRIEDGQVSGDVSIPTDKIPGGQGRFFNGSASFDVSMENGVLIVRLTDAEVNGQTLPQPAIDAMAQENLAKEVYKDPKNSEALRRIEKVSIEDDKIILKVRREPTSPDAVGEPKQPDEPQQPATDSTTTEPKGTDNGATLEPADSEPADSEPADTEPGDTAIP